MQRQAQPKAKEDKGPMISMKLGGGAATTGGAKSTGGGGFKKGGFKNAFAEVEDEPAEVQKEESAVDTIMRDSGVANVGNNDSDVTDEEDYYDPSKPTDCHLGCTAKLVPMST